MSSKRRPTAAPAACPLLILPLFAFSLLPLASVAQTTPAVSTVVAFSASAPAGNLARGTDGALYGATYTSSTVTGGIIYRAAVDGSSVTTLYQFGTADGISPQAGLLVGSDGRLYGTTRFGKRGSLDTTGTIFSIGQDGQGFTTIHSFAAYTTTNAATLPINTDGAYPQAELIEGTDTYLYGVNTAGGANGNGTIFRLTRDGTAFETVHEFGAITSASGETLHKNADGMQPLGPLVQGADGYLYGTTSLGGANGRGTIFRVGMDGSAFQLIHVFTATTTNTTTNLVENEDGATPTAGLTDGQDGFFYGVASAGGTSGHGTIFATSPDGATFRVLHNFAGNDGSGPNVELTLGNDGKLYGATRVGGTTSSGSSSSLGTIFSIARDGTGFTSLHSMDSKNGYNPSGKLLQISDTVFVGTNGTGGACGSGTIYRYSTSGDTVTGNTKCGRKKSTTGGGSTEPALLLLMGGLGLARRRRR